MYVSIVIRLYARGLSARVSQNSIASIASCRVEFKCFKRQIKFVTFVDTQHRRNFSETARRSADGTEQSRRKPIEESCLVKRVIADIGKL